MRALWDQSGASHKKRWLFFLGVIYLTCFLPVLSSSPSTRSPNPLQCSGGVTDAKTRPRILMPLLHKVAFFKDVKERCLCRKDQSFRNTVSSDFWSGSVLGRVAKENSHPAALPSDATGCNTIVSSFKLLLLTSVSSQQLIFTWVAVSSKLVHVKTRD